MKTEKFPKHLFSFAERARKITEIFAERHTYVGNPDTLLGYCAIGSRILYLINDRYNLTFVQGYCGNNSKFSGTYNWVNHCWIHYKSFVIDITATQFDYDESVLILKKNEASMHHPVVYHDLFDASWGKENPNHYVNEIDELIKRV